MANFRTDQFDAIPENVDRIGAHRGPKVRGRGWITFAWAVLATAVLVFGGLYVLSIFDNQVKFGLGGSSVGEDTPSATGTPTPVITPITDPSTIKARHITVTVLNGTDLVGLQNQVAAKLKAAGWVIEGATNSSSTDIKTTTVYYSDSANIDVAEGIQALLGAENIQFSAAFPGSPITVVVGKSYSN